MTEKIKTEISIQLVQVTVPCLVLLVLVSDFARSTYPNCLSKNQPLQQSVQLFCTISSQDIKNHVLFDQYILLITSL